MAARDPHVRAPGMPVGRDPNDPETPGANAEIRGEEYDSQNDAFGTGRDRVGGGVGLRSGYEPETREACYEGARSSNSDLYQIRTLGRSEKHMIGEEATGYESIGEVGMHGTLQQSSLDIYELRLLGRAEAYAPERILPETAVDHAPQTAFADEEPDADIYGIRAEGRARAHETGSDYCGLLPSQEDRL